MLLQLGFYYSELEGFVKAERFSASRKVKSQYRCALANGIQGVTPSDSRTSQIWDLNMCLLTSGYVEPSWEKNV